ncbi:MAG: murein hydrolase activator EnvC family protein [Succinivibrionaceae bacterium]
MFNHFILVHNIKVSPNSIWRNLFLLLLLCIICSFNHVESNVKEKNNLQKNINNYTNLLEQHSKKLAKINQEKNEINKKLNIISEQLSLSKSELDQNLKHMNALQREIHDIFLQLNYHKKIFSEYIKTLYILKSPKNTSLEKLLNSKKQNLIVSKSFYEIFINKKREEISKIQTLSKKLQIKQDELDNNIKKLKSLNEKYQTNYTLEKLKHTQQIQNEIDINKKIKNDSIQLQKYKQALYDLNEKLEKENKKYYSNNKNIKNNQIKNFHGLKKQKGKLPWPHKGSILRNFHINQDSSWTGILISGSPNDNVHSIEKGQVLYAGWLNGLGNIVIINHGMNFLSLYGNNNKNIVNTGDYVEQGDVIAKIGNTGIFRTNSLYFEIRANGTPINPIKYLKKAYK